jgi:hypothetical protein
MWSDSGTSEAWDSVTLEDLEWRGAERPEALSHVESPQDFERLGSLNHVHPIASNAEFYLRHMRSQG